MAEHAEKSAETKEKRTLDPSAIDHAIAALRPGGPETGQGAADKTTPADGDDTEAASAASQAPVHANGGDTFGEVQSDGQEDLDAAIAAIQADVVDEAATIYTAADDTDPVDQGNTDGASAALPAGGVEDLEAAARNAAGPEIARQDDPDGAVTAMGADAREATETAAADLPAGDTPAGQNTEAAIGATAPGAAGKLAPDLTEDGVRDVSAAKSTMGDETASGREAIDFENHRDAPKKSNSPPGEGAADSALVQTGSGVDAPAEAENTFSDLDESDLDDCGAGRAATEAEQLAAMTASFDDEEEYDETSGEDMDLAAAKKKPSRKALARSSRKAGRPGKLRGVLLIGAIILVGVAALYGRDFYSAYRERRQTPETPPAAVEKASAVPVPAAPAAAPKPHDPYREKLQEVGRLRADLLSKKNEIDQLKQFYRDGISELEEELQQEAVRHRINTFDEAVANHKIELDLGSIQRRWAYIDALEKPLNWLNQGSEELLFLSRRAQIDLHMSTIASGIELTRHNRHLNASLEKYQLSPERLSIDLTNSRLRPLEDIWNAIGEQNKTIARQVVANGDQEIIADICDGHTGRIAELKTLTIKASKCLSRIDSSELFLNQLSSISPVAAKYLSNWGGQWLCLNGFRQLSPEVARYLFKWDGSWISLNGLKDFPPEIGEMLLSWQGRQLELMGLVQETGKTERIGYQQLADWEKSGGKLFVPERVRSEIDTLNRD